MALPDTRRVLTPAARLVVEVLVVIGFIALGGIEIYRAVHGSDAQAAPVSSQAALEQNRLSLEQIGADVRDIKAEQSNQSRDIAVIKRQLGLDGLGPPPVRASGVGR